MSERFDMNGKLTRREFCAQISTVATGTTVLGLNLFGAKNHHAMAADCGISPLFQTLWLPTLVENPATLCLLRDRFDRGDFPATVVLRGESYVSSQYTATLSRSLINCGMNPLVRADVLKTLTAGLLEPIAANTLAKFDHEIPTAILFLEPARGVWSGYVAARDFSAADFSRYNDQNVPKSDRLRLARRIDLAVKAVA